MFLLDRPTNATIQIPDAFARIPVANASPSSLVPARIPIISPQYSGVPTDAEGEPSFADVVHKLVNAYEFLRARAVLITVFTMVGVAGGMTSLFVSPPGVSAVAEVKLLPHMTLNSPTAEDRWQNIDQDSPTFVKSAEYALTQREFVRSELMKFGEPDPSDARIRAVSGKMKVEETGDHVFRATYKDSLTARPAPLPLLSSMVQDYVQGRGRQVAARDGRQGRLSARPAQVGGEGSGELSAPSARRSGRRTPIGSPRTRSRRTAAASTWRPGAPSCPAQVRQLQAELIAEQEQLRTNRPEAQRKFQRSETYRQSLTEINRKLSEAYSRGLGDAHPEVQQLKQEQKRLEALASDELQAPTPTLSRESDPNYQQAQSRIEKLQAQLSATRGQPERHRAEPRRGQERGEG